MYIKHSLKNVLRSWPKSALFFLLIAALCVTLCIGVSMTASIVGFLRECDEIYTTIAVFEYIGADYPNESQLDPNISLCVDEFDTGAIMRHPAVLGWDENATAFGSVAGKTVYSANPPYKDSCVAVICIMGYNEAQGYYPFVIEEDLADPNPAADDVRVIAALFDSPIDLEQGHLYLANLSIASHDIVPFVNAAAVLAGVDGSVENMIIDITAPDSDSGYIIPDDCLLSRIAETFFVMNAGVTVYATNDAEALLPFHQADLSVIDGRGFTSSEYDNGDKVCLLPQRFAALVDAKVGDTIDLSLAVQAEAPWSQSYWAGTGFAYEDTYTVVGIFNPNDSYRDTIFIPKSGTADLSDNRWSYTLGQATLKNSQADKFYLDIVDKLPQKVRMTIYDQGYAAAAAPLNDVLRIAAVLTIVCFLAALAILALFGYLFIYRQRAIAKTMHRQGAPKRGIYGYFTFGSGCIALLSAAVGAAASVRLSSVIMEIVRRIIADYSAADLHYSNAALSVSKSIEFAPVIAISIFVLTAFALFALAVLSTCIFTAISIRGTISRKRRRKTGAVDGSLRSGTGSRSLSGESALRAVKPRKATFRVATSRAAGTSSRSLSGGVWKYAWLSIWRGGYRSAIPIVLCALAAALLMQLTRTTAAYKENYELLVDGTDISGYLSDYRGIWRSGLLLSGTAVNDFYNSGKLSEVSVQKTACYIYNVEPPPPGSSSFVLETFKNKLAGGASFIWTNDLTLAQEFFRYDPADLPVTFMDGFDMSIFTEIFKDGEADTAPQSSGRDNYKAVTYRSATGPRGYFDAIPGIVSADFLDMNDLAYGDIIAVNITGESDTAYQRRTVEIIGSFTKQGLKDNIYVPLAFYRLIKEGESIFDRNERVYYSRYTDIPVQYAFTEEPEFDYLRQLTFDSVSFKTRGAAGLAEFKDFLYERDYSGVNLLRGERTFVVFEDKTFLAAKSAMSQRMWYMERIYPALYALLEFMAALIPLILIQLRRRELALMRAQGAAKHTAFLSIFWEQVMLCVPGVAIGIAAHAAILGSSAGTGRNLALLFTLLWLLGAAVSAVVLNRGSVRKILKAEE